MDEDDAKDVMSFYNVMLQNFQNAVNVSTNPKDITYNEFVKSIQNIEYGITIPELCKIVTENNKQVKAYIGEVWSIDRNKKLRRVIDEVLNNSNIKKIGSKPMVLQWLSDHTDHSDRIILEEQHENQTEETPNKDSSRKIKGHMGHIGQMGIRTKK